MSVSPPFHWKCTLTHFGAAHRCSYAVKSRSDPATAVESQHCLKPSRIQVRKVNGGGWNKPLLLVRLSVLTGLLHWLPSVPSGVQAGCCSHTQPSTFVSAAYKGRMQFSCYLVQDQDLNPTLVAPQEDSYSHVQSPEWHQQSQPLVFSLKDSGFFGFSF